MTATMTTSATNNVADAAASRPAAAKRAARSSDLAMPVVVATEGLPGSHSAMVVARLIAERMQRPLRVVTVIEPTIIFAGSSGLMPMPVVMDESLGETRLQLVKEAIATTWPVETTYELETRYGTIAHELADAANESKASLLLVGATPRQRGQQLLSGVLASQVVRRTRCPVMSVAPALDHIPRQIVVAMDFSAPSIRAAREAVTLLDEGGTLTLAHVLPIVPDSPVSTPTGVAGEPETTHRLERLREHLLQWLPKQGTIGIRVLRGVAQDQILDLAVSLHADLVATGSHGSGIVERMFVGSVAANILHGTSCSVLVAPKPDARERSRLDLEAWGTTESTDQVIWRELVDEFTRRNADRPVRLEVDDPAIGAQVQASGYLLRGVTFDPVDQRVDVMLGAAADETMHLTRTIPGVLAIGVARNSAGHDIALEIRTEAGETLVMFN